MIESDLIYNLEQNLVELRNCMSNFSNMDQKLQNSIVEASTRIHEILPIFKSPNDAIAVKLLKFLITKTNLLIERLKIFYAYENAKKENKQELILIYSIINDINNSLDQFKEDLLQIECKNLHNETIKDLSETLKLTKEFDLNYSNLQDKIRILNNLATDKIKEIDTTFQSKIKELKEQLGEVESSIAKKALSASFLTRADKLEAESKWWLLASFISILLFIGLALYNFYTFTKINDLNLDSLNLHIRASIIYSPICISLFWSIWFCTKKYTHLCHLRDEYNYKHDLSESFIGYKEEVSYLDKLKSSDVQLFPILLSAVIQNICKSPLETNKEECHSPWSEIVSLVCKKGKDKIE